MKVCKDGLFFPPSHPARAQTDELQTVWDGPASCWTVEDQTLPVWPAGCVWAHAVSELVIFLKSAPVFLRVDGSVGQSSQHKKQL